jgi:Ca-activated chloride channel family protein
MRKRAVLVVLVLIVATGILRAGPDTQPRAFRSGVDLVLVSVAVTDSRGNLVEGLSAEDFEIVEDGRPQSVTYFANGDDTDVRPPLRLGLLFDTSESMIEDLRFSKTAAIKFLNTLTEAADITLVDFDTEVRVARFQQDGFPRLVERIRETKSKGWTALHDALGVYLDGAYEEDGDKVLVVFTDGGDTRSNLDFRGALDLLKASTVTVYAVGLLEHQPSYVKMDQRMRLQQLAQITGGLALFPHRKEDLDEMYSRIAREVRARYSLGYVSSNPRADGAWREVKVRLTRSDLKNARIRSRDGYYAPYREGNDKDQP